LGCSELSGLPVLSQPTRLAANAAAGHLDVVLLMAMIRMYSTACLGVTHQYYPISRNADSLLLIRKILFPLPNCLVVELPSRSIKIFSVLPQPPKGFPPWCTSHALVLVGSGVASRSLDLGE
jgi:hypothetical protein